MRTWLFTLIVHFCGCHEIEEVYVADPKRSFNPNWQSMSLILQHNKEFTQDLKFNDHQRHFVHEMINMPNVVPLTPVKAIHIVDETPHAWIILAYNSDSDDNLPGINEVNHDGKGLARALTLLFYERCGVTVLDMAYPSNHYTFGAVVDETPMIIFRKPNAQHQMFHAEHLHPDQSHFQLDKIHKWGYPFKKSEMESDIFQVIHKLNHLYEEWVEPNYKVLATAMEHYTDENKQYVQMLVRNLVKHYHDLAEYHAINKLGLLPSSKREDLYTDEEKDENDERFFEFIIHYIHDSIVKMDLSKWLSERLEETLKDESIDNESKKELLRYISPIKPREQPFVGHLLKFWLHHHNEL